MRTIQRAPSASKFGLKELVPILGPVVAAIGIFVAAYINSPRVTVRPIGLRAEAKCNAGANAWEIWARIVYRIDNTGSGDTSLISIEQRKSIYPVRAEFTGTRQQYPVPARLLFPRATNQTSFIGGPLDLDMEFSGPNRGARIFINPGSSEEFRPVLIKSDLIASGGAAEVALGLKVDWMRRPAPIRRLFLDLTFVFSRGGRKHVGVPIEVELGGEGACPP